MFKKNIFLLLITFTCSEAAGSPELDRAKSLNNSGNPQGASKALYRIVNNARYRKEQSEIYYELAKSFSAMNLRQPAVFNLIRAIKTNPRGRNLSKYLEVLSKLSFEIGDDVGLNYALSKINIKSFPRNQKPILYFRFGQAYLRVGKFKKASGFFKKIPKGHHLYSKAKYFLGLSFSEMGKLKKSYSAFTQSANSRADDGVVDNQRVAALMGRARVLYHMKKWEASLNAYRVIPRDSKYFHDMLFESSWAMLRGGKFRSALSNFQSLHSEYYDNYYFPEATLLRAIIYLYICKAGEVDKVVKVYEKTYGKMNKELKRYLRENSSTKKDIIDYLTLREELETGTTKARATKARATKAGVTKAGTTKAGVKNHNYTIPYVLLRELNRSSKVQARAGYYYNLKKDLQRIDAMEEWSNTSVASFAKKIIEKRKKGSLKRLGRTIRAELLYYRKELDGFDNQKELIKFELVSTEKEEARKKLEGRDDFNAEVNVKSSRFNFRKNGYEYWPFQGEYWLDEIGNYHYLGVSRCE